MIESIRYMQRLAESLGADQTLPTGFQEELMAIAEEILEANPMDSMDGLLISNSVLATKVAALLAHARRRAADLNRETDNFYYKNKQETRQGLIVLQEKVVEARLDETVRASGIYQTLKFKRDQADATASSVEQFSYILRDRQRSLAEISVNRRHMSHADEESA